MIVGIKRDLKVEGFPAVKFTVEIPDNVTEEYSIEFLTRFFADWMTDGFIYLYILASPDLAGEFLKRSAQLNFHLACSLED
jgi:hypothetical protein